MAPRKRPSALPSLAIIWREAEIAPADSPQLNDSVGLKCRRMCLMPYIVTFDGSPPNAVIYFCIHRNASRSMICFQNCRMLWRLERLTILKTKVPNSSFFDFFASQETETYRCFQTKQHGSLMVFTCNPRSPLVWCRVLIPGMALTCSSYSRRRSVHPCQ